ncbi:endonuclease domain-containing protein [Hymenobacter humi]|uniref:Endonuclease domain-containing protein n=1 Tax=Hymenobacter humi TaxID=1411620 RepID=A0ABW2UA73_9BACT
MEEPTRKLGGPQEHIFTTTVRTWDKAKAYARENRKQPTPAEQKLWQYLRASKLGAKFRRQHAINFFIVDFICLEAKLIIELDGEIHATPDQSEYDVGRTFTLKELGYRELRFTNQQVLNQLDEVLATIAENLKVNTLEYPLGSPSFWRGGRG